MGGGGEGREMLLTHGLELGGELVLGPLLLLAPEAHRVRHHQLAVVRVGHVQVVHQHDVRILHREIFIRS